MKRYDELIAATKKHVTPLLLFLKDGNPMKKYDIDQDKTFSTVYYIPIQEKEDYYVFKLLKPVYFYNQLFFKKMKSTVTLEKDCLLGVHVLSKGIIANKVTISQEYVDCIEGAFSIAENFQQTVIWQSNDKRFSGLACLEYESGKDAFLEVHAISDRNIIHKYKLSKHKPKKIPLDDIQYLKIIKQDSDAIATGLYSIEVNGEMAEKVTF